MKSVRSFLKQHWVRLFLNLVAWFLIGNATCNNSRSCAPVHSEELRYIAAIVGFNLLFAAIVYLHNLRILPRTLFRKKNAAYLGWLSLLLLLSSLITAAYSEYLRQIFPTIKQHCFSAFSFGNRTDFDSYAEYIISVMIAIFFLIFLFGTGLLAQRFFVVNRQRELLQQQQQAAELSLLKSQINPHFLFNVLNSIYSLSLKKSERTPELVLKLSDLLRYMLYETRQEFVPLEKEIQLATDYLAIEKIRLNQSAAIHWECQVNTTGMFIAPLLLLPFLENAVKHGLDSLAESAFVRASLNVDKGTLQFSCINNYKAIVRREAGGIGLENVQKRLQMLYPGKHKLQINDTNGNFDVNLSINLIA